MASEQSDVLHHGFFGQFFNRISGEENRTSFVPWNAGRVAYSMLSAVAPELNRSTCKNAFTKTSSMKPFKHNSIRMDFYQNLINEPHKTQ